MGTSRRIVARLFASALVIAIPLLALTSPALAEGPNAIVAVPSAGSADSCRDNTLTANDDGSAAVLTLPFTIDFFGNNFQSVYVNNNGNITFTGSLATYTPFAISGAHTPIIAPFFADVDTRGAGSGLVQYAGRSFGLGTFAGRPTFCANWVNVGYYSGHTDKLNSFQLLLVDRSDVGTGDFDIYFNYDKVRWETGDASGGIGGLGGSPARVGYSNGTTTSFEMPGSGVTRAFIDDSANGLIHGSRNSTQLGRYIFNVRNGSAPTGSTFNGHVYANTVGNAVGGAFVQACGFQGGCSLATSGAGGAYTISGLAPDSYTLTATGPGGTNLTPGTLGPVVVTSTSTINGLDFTLTGPTPPPSGTTITQRGTNAGGLPIIYWRDDLTLTTHGCVGGAASYEMFLDGAVVRGDVMTEGPAGAYTAIIRALYPQHGYAHVVITIVCGGSPTTIPFDIYIDPSGTVRTTLGAPVAGATVRLLRSDSSSGPFTLVPDGSGIMSVANRRNPDTTDASGHFGWDVISGFYVVEASAPDCTSSTDPTQSVERSAVLTIPPAVTDLDLRLICVLRDTTPPVSTATATPAANADGWNKTNLTVALAATDETGGSGVRDITYGLSGATILPDTAYPGAAVSTTITAEGATTVTYFATDNTGNVETPRDLVVRIDKTAPATTASGAPAANASGWNRGPVSVTLTATDARSGVATTEFSLDGSSFAVYAAPINVTGNGTHTLLYRSTDRAGNVEDAKTLTIRIDGIAPEGYLRFDGATRDLVFIGIDTGSGATAAVRTTLPANGGDKRERRSYRVTDNAGNSIDVTVLIQRGTTEVHGWVESVSYNGDTAITESTNQIHASWSTTDAGDIRQLEQGIEFDTLAAASAHFSDKKNATSIELGATQHTLPGLSYIRLATNGGNLIVQAD